MKDSNNITDKTEYSKSSMSSNERDEQEKIKERLSGIPTDEWLNSSKVYISKSKHLELLGLLKAMPDRLLILDAGCGPGTYGIILAEQGKFDVIGVDISKMAIKKAQERSSQKNLNFCAIEGDLESLCFKDATFDVVFLGWTLHHFPSLDSICSELCRVLKPGGKIAIVEPNEANLMMRFSRPIEDIFRPIILKIGWDTPNRTIHDYKEYLQELQKMGIIDLEHSSCSANLPPILNSRNLFVNAPLNLIYYLRTFLFSLSTKILPRPLNGPDLLITGKKKEIQ